MTAFSQKARFAAIRDPGFTIQSRDKQSPKVPIERFTNIFKWYAYLFNKNCS